MVIQKVCEYSILSTLSIRPFPFRISGLIRTVPGIDLAQDPNVDLVVGSVRVDKHFAAIAPALKAGKNVFVEWPLGKNLEEAEELLRMSVIHGVKQTAVGLQGRFAPSIIKLQELVTQGRIGKVLSSTWVGYAGNMGPTESESLKYMTDKNIGGNLVTVHFGHVSDYIQQGEYDSQSPFLPCL
jgi:predicted dehydrogenase